MTINYQRNLSELIMKKNIIMIILAITSTITACSNMQKKQLLGQEIAWYCGTSAAVKKTGFTPFKEEKKECVEMKADRESYWDFYIRDYEKDGLPNMPDSD